jgi:hypothetical protein
MNYKKFLQEEIYYCVKHIGLTYQDLQNMPTYERRNYLLFFMNEQDKKREVYEKQKTQGGKGKQSKSVSGDMLKNKIKSGEIPN